MCLACAVEFDFARNQHLAHERMMAASVGFGRVAGASGQLLGQAAGSMVTGAVGGVMRLASGAAHGVQQTVAGLRMNETPSPVRPRVLELMEDQLAVSEAGSQEAVTATASATAGTFEQEVMEQLKALRAENDKLKAENEELKKKNESPGAVSSEIFGEPASERQAEEEQQQEAGAEDLVEDWSGQGLPMIGG